MTPVSQKRQLFMVHALFLWVLIFMVHFSCTCNFTWCTCVLFPRLHFSSPPKAAQKAGLTGSKLTEWKKNWAKKDTRNSMEMHLPTWCAIKTIKTWKHWIKRGLMFDCVRSIPSLQDIQEGTKAYIRASTWYSNISPQSTHSGRKVRLLVQSRGGRLVTWPAPVPSFLVS